MKPYFVMLPLVLLLLLSVGCEENFSPKTDFEESVVLNCVVGIDMRIEPPPAIYCRAYLFRAYDVEGLDPEANTFNPSIEGANVTFSVQESVYEMRQNVDINNEYWDYDEPLGFYAYSADLIPNDFLGITAILPDGRKIWAATRVPPSVTIEPSVPFRGGFTADYGNVFQEVSFQWINTPNNNLFFPEFILYYTHLDSNKQYSIELPTQYNNDTPIYPGFTRDTLTTYSFTAIDRAFESISIGDTAKSKYRMDYVEFTMREFDYALSNYYSSVNGALDRFSIRNDQTIYTNVNGGYGIFGSYVINAVDYKIRPTYAEKFGYTYD